MVRNGSFHNDNDLFVMHSHFWHFFWTRNETALTHLSVVALSEWLSGLLRAVILSVAMAVADREYCSDNLAFKYFISVTGYLRRKKDIDERIRTVVFSWEHTTHLHSTHLTHPHTYTLLTTPTHAHTYTLLTPPTHAHTSLYSPHPPTHLHSTHPTHPHMHRHAVWGIIYVSLIYVQNYLTTASNFFVGLASQNII